MKAIVVLVFSILFSVLLRGLTHCECIIHILLPSFQELLLQNSNTLRMHNLVNVMSIKQLYNADCSRSNMNWINANIHKTQIHQRVYHMQNFSCAMKISCISGANILRQTISSVNISDKCSLIEWMPKTENFFSYYYHSSQ